jgi:hypothetical protein
MVEPFDSVTWDEMFSTADPSASQPVVTVPMRVFEAERDAIVTAARKNGYMRVLCIKDQANAHFCRYV